MTSQKAQRSLNNCRNIINEKFNQIYSMSYEELYTNGPMQRELLNEMQTSLDQNLKITEK